MTVHCPHVLFYKPCLILSRRFYMNQNHCNTFVDFKHFSDSSMVSLLWKKPVCIKYSRILEPQSSIHLNTEICLPYLHKFLISHKAFTEIYKLAEIPHVSFYNNLSSNFTRKSQKTSKDIDTDLPSESQLYELMNYFQEKTPKLFSNQGWTYDKCSERIVFQNMMFSTETSTKRSYIFQINLLKMIMKLIFETPELSIVRITKNHLDGTIHVRWQIQGTPWWLKMHSLFYENHRQYIRYVDGFSMFYVKSDGLYHKHILMKMTPLRNENKESSLSSFLTKIGYFSPDFEHSPKSASIPVVKE